MKILRALLLLLVLLAVLVAGVFFFAPWKAWVGTRLSQILSDQGFKDVRMVVADVGPTQMDINDISVGADNPLVLKNLQLGYALNDLIKGRLQHIDLKGLHIAAQQKDGGWVITGFEKNNAGGAGFKLPVTQATMQAMPLDSLKLAESHLLIDAPQLHLDAPLEIDWQANPAKINYTAGNWQAKIGAIGIASGKVSLQATLDEKAQKWIGTWQMDNVQISDAAMPLPPLTGKGTLEAFESRITMKGEFKSADGKTRASFKADISPNAPDKNQLTLVSAGMPWNGGDVSVASVDIPLNGKRDIRLNVNVTKVSVDTLLQTLTDKHASGSGAVSGVIPVTLKAGGGLEIAKGALNADGPGTITMAPETIPGDNEQVTLVRDILKNLQYKVLGVTAETGPNHTLSVVMTLEGHNPDVYEGKPVKLNVHLTGDVLNFIEQGVMSLIDPKALLKQIPDGNQK